MAHQVIQGIQVGVWQGQVAWVMTCADGHSASFAVSPATARAFLEGLQQVLAALAAPPSGMQDGVGMQEQVSVRLV